MNSKLMFLIGFNALVIPSITLASDSKKRDEDRTQTSSTGSILKGGFAGAALGGTFGALTSSKSNMQSVIISCATFWGLAGAYIGWQYHVSSQAKRKSDRASKPNTQ